MDTLGFYFVCAELHQSLDLSVEKLTDVLCPPNKESGYLDFLRTPSMCGRNQDQEGACVVSAGTGAFRQTDPIRLREPRRCRTTAAVLVSRCPSPPAPPACATEVSARFKVPWLVIMAFLEWITLMRLHELLARRS